MTTGSCLLKISRHQSVIVGQTLYQCVIFWIYITRYCGQIALSGTCFCSAEGQLLPTQRQICSASLHFLAWTYVGCRGLRLSQAVALHRASWCERMGSMWLVDKNTTGWCVRVCAHGRVRLRIARLSFGLLFGFPPVWKSLGLIPLPLVHLSPYLSVCLRARFGLLDRPSVYLHLLPTRLSKCALLFTASVNVGKQTKKHAGHVFGHTFWRD